MKTKTLCFGALALIQAVTFSGNALDSEVEIQQTAVGFSIEIGPGGGPYYYDPYYDPWGGPCYGPGGIYLGPGCPRYYYGPRYYHRDGWHDGRGRHHHRGRGHRR